MVINNRRIYLIGYMGSGKTTIGRSLAEKLGFQFIDVDHFIENRYRKTISEIFSEKGEDAFRLMEHKALEELSLFENVIISTGGGAPCFHNNMELMNQSGLTIYLKTSPEELTGRLKITKNKRPLLKGKSQEQVKAFIIENLDKRNHYYNQAQLIFEAEKILPNPNVNNIVNNLILYLAQNKKQ